MRDRVAIVTAFIVENFYVRDRDALAEDASLLDQGIVDSTGVLAITAFLEQQFALSIGDDEIVSENLETIAKIAAFVARKRTLAA